MSLERIHQIMDEVLGSSFTNKVLGDLAPVEPPDKNDTSWLDEDAPAYDASVQVDQTRDYIADVLMDFLTNDRDPAYVYSMLKDKVNGLELSALIGEVQHLKEEPKQ